MTETVTVPKEEWEKLVKEVEELKQMLEDYYKTLQPILYIVKKLPDLLTDPTMYKSLTPIFTLLSTMDNINITALNALTYGGMTCLDKAIKQAMIDPNKPPEFSITKLLSDKETKIALGILIELLKAMMPCLYDTVRDQTKP
ncbi:MAG: DUF1641 domain-containing protein [Sulfolobaceae archaeon]|nr:DUF1641 domain-containing protein [Sulfolobaceae archaeon]